MIDDGPWLVTVPAFIVVPLAVVHAAASSGSEGSTPLTS